MFIILKGEFLLDYYQYEKTITINFDLQGILN